MRLTLSDKGTREESEKLYKYLIDYQDNLSKTLRDKGCHYMAEAIEKQTSELITQHGKSLQQGNFIIGWQ